MHFAIPQLPLLTCLQIGFRSEMLELLFPSQSSSVAAVKAVILVYFVVVFFFLVLLLTEAASRSFSITVSQKLSRGSERRHFSAHSVSIPLCYQYKYQYE